MYYGTGKCTELQAECMTAVRNYGILKPIFVIEVIEYAAFLRFQGVPS